LSIPRAKQIAHNRKEGNQVIYSLCDPALIQVLEVLKGYFFSRLTQSVNLLEEIRQQPNVQQDQEVGSVS
jgi:ArsR family transcriptional regulator